MHVLDVLPEAGRRYLLLQAFDQHRHVINRWISICLLGPLRTEKHRFIPACRKGPRLCDCAESVNDCVTVFLSASNDSVYFLGNLISLYTNILTFQTLKIPEGTPGFKLRIGPPYPSVSWKATNIRGGGFSEEQ